MESIKSFGLVFLVILLIYGIWNIFGVLNPSNPGLLPALIGIKSNILYIPLIFVGICVSMDHKFAMKKFINMISWPILIVLSYGLIQVFTGFDTIIEPGVTGVWSELGGDLRSAGEAGQLLVIASTLYGGLLSPYGLIWFIILLSMILSYQYNNSYVMIILASSILLMLLPINRTVIVSAMIIVILFLIFSRRTLIQKKNIIICTFILISLFLLKTLLEQSEFINIDDWIVMFMEMFNPESRLGVTVDLMEGIKNILPIGGLAGLGLGIMTQGTQHVGFDPYIIQYGLINTESIIHKMLLELGIIGLFIYMAIIIYLIIFLYKLMSNMRMYNKKMSLIPLGALNLLVGYILLSYKHHGFGSNATIQIYIFFFIGLFVGYTKRYKLYYGLAKQNNNFMSYGRVKLFTQDRVRKKSIPI